MAEWAAAGKTAATMARPTATFLKGALAEREHFDCLEGFLKLAITAALAESGPDVRYAVPENAVDGVVKLALARARAESDDSTWYKIWKRLGGKLRRRTPDLGVYRTDVMQQVIAGWIRAGLPTGFDDWKDFAERAAAGFRRALYAAHEPGAKLECLEFAKELETKFRETDALYKVYDEQERTRKAAAVVAATGAAGTAALGIFEAVELSTALLPVTGVVAGAAVIASGAILYRARKEARWDQAAARAIRFDTALDWLRDVREGNLKAAEARELLRNRVMPRLADYDVPVLVALLDRIADLVEDRAASRSSFTERQLEELLTRAATFLSQDPPLDQAAALDIRLDTARDWLRDVREGNLKAAEARELLRNRVMPRLADYDVPVLVALLDRIADLVEDRAASRSSFSDHQLERYGAAVRQLEDLFRQAAALLSQSPDQVDWAHKRQ